MGNVLISLLTSFLGWGYAISTSAQTISQSDFQKLVDKGVDANALSTSLKAYDWAAAQGKIKKPIMTLINFDKPSDQKRMWVIDMHHSPKLLYSELVTHAQKSGGRYATHFSNIENSHTSSIGAMIASEDYIGKYGLSVKVDGLEKGLNNNVRQRHIVFHPSTYATPSFLKKKGRLGRSWGCFAIDPKDSKKVFQTIKDGSFVFVYAKAIKKDIHFA